MKLNKVLKTAKAIVKDEPLNLEEKIEFLEKKMNTKISHFEESMATVHSIIIKISDENQILKEENIMLKKALANRESVSSSLLDGIKERVVQPIMKEGQELAELVFKDQLEDEKEEKPYKKHTIEPETEFDKHKKTRDPIPQQEEKAGPNAKEKTIKWMRQKFGLTPHIEEKSKAKSKKYKKK